MRFFTFLLIAWAVIFTSVGLCFASNATRLIDSAPAYNACNGEFVETVTITDCQCFVYASNILITGGPELEITDCQCLVYSSGTELSKLTNVTPLIVAAPTYDACDGSFVESVTITPCQCLIYASDVTLTISPLYIEIIDCQSLVKSARFGNQREYRQFRTWGNNRTWSGNSGVEWKSNNAILIQVGQ